MQLFSLCLAATALLAQAASAASYHLSSPDPQFRFLGLATIDNAIKNDPVGFFQAPTLKYQRAEIDLQADGSIGHPFVLHQVADGEWQFVAGQHVQRGPKDITGPFAVLGERFVYTGPGGGVWNACHQVDEAGFTGHILVLSRVPITRQGCIADVKLEAHIYE